MIRAESSSHARKIVETAAVTLALEGKDIGRGVITIQVHARYPRGEQWLVDGVLSVAEIRRKADEIRAESERVNAAAAAAVVGGE